MFSFIETRLFTKLVVDYMTDEEYSVLQTALMTDPKASKNPESRGVSTWCSSPRVVLQFIAEHKRPQDGKAWSMHVEA